MPEGNSTEKILAEILRWIRPAAYPYVESQVKKEFYKTDGALDLPRAVAYSLTDGKMKAVDIAKRAGISQPTVSRLWARWRQLGLAEAAEGRQTAASFNLETFGVTVPGAQVIEEQPNEPKQAE
jgi:hypothetical protein